MSEVLEQLQKSFVNAHKAGDTDAAKRLAEEIVRQMQQDEDPEIVDNFNQPDDPPVTPPGAKVLPKSITDAIGRAKSGQSFNGPTGQHFTALKVPKAVGVLGAAAEGGSLGSFDEIASGVKSLVGDQTYTQALDETRQQQEMFRRENPNTAMAAEFIGAAPLMAMPFMAGPKAASLAGKMAVGAGSGAVQGGVYGFNSGEGDNRVDSAGIGAALGGGIGAAVPVAGQSVKHIVRNILARQARNKTGMNKAAHNILRENLGDDVVAPTGKDAMMADASPNLAEMLDTSIQSSGPARNLATTRVTDRVSRASGRVTGALDDAMGRPGVSQSRAVVPYGSKNPVGEMYDRAYSTPINYATETGRSIDDMVLNRVPDSAIRQANALMRAEGEGSKQILAEIAEDGSVVFLKKPDVRQIDYMTRALNDVAETQEGKGALGGVSNLGRVYQRLSSDIRVALKENVPAYKNALDVAAGVIREGKAKESGLALLSTRITRDEADDILRGMGKAELRKVGEGVRQHIDDTLARVKRTLGNPNTDHREAAKAITELSSRQNRDKIQMLLGPDEAGQLFAKLDDAGTAFELRAAVADGSATHTRKMMDEAIKAQTDQGVVNFLRSGHPIKSGSTIASKILGRSPASVQRAQDKTYTNLADFLTAQNPAENLAAFRAANQNIVPQSEAAAEMIERILRGNLAVSGQASQFRGR